EPHHAGTRERGARGAPRRQRIERDAQILPVLRAAAGAAPQHPDRPVVADDVARAGALVQAVDVLRDQREARRLAPLRDDVMRGVGLTLRDHAAAPFVPLPDECWILPEGFWCGELR